MWARKFGVKAAGTALLLGPMPSLINHGWSGFEALGQETPAQRSHAGFCWSPGGMVKSSQDDDLISRHFSPYIPPGPVLESWKGWEGGTTHMGMSSHRWCLKSCPISPFVILSAWNTQVRHQTSPLTWWCWHSMGEQIINILHKWNFQSWIFW